jgi:hypothetical protein
MGRAHSTNGEKTAYRLLVGKPEGKRQLERTRMSWWIIVKCISQNGVVLTGLIWLRIGTSGGPS